MYYEKILTLICTVLFIFPIEAYALPFDTIRYGEYINNTVSMEGTLTDNCTFHNTKGYTGGKTDAQKHTGNYSFGIDLASSEGN